MTGNNLDVLRRLVACNDNDPEQILEMVRERCRRAANTEDFMREVFAPQRMGRVRV